MVGNDFDDNFVNHTAECYESKLVGHGGFVFLGNESKKGGIKSWTDYLCDA